MLLIYMKEITDIFKNTNSKFIKSGLAEGKIVIGEKIPEFEGILINDKIYAERLAVELKTKFGIKGFISTDELPAYGISQKEKEDVCSSFDCGINDIVIFIIDTREKCETAMMYLLEEIKKYK